MGMFDSIFVHKSLIDNLDLGSDVHFQLENNGFYSFQTKDLDNSLTEFYIESDGSFSYKKQDFKYEEPKEQRTGWNFGSLIPVGEPEMIQDLRVAYIEFYDFIITDEERIWVTLQAHVKKGKLVEPIFIKNIERTNLEEERNQSAINRKLWERINSSWEWKIADLIFKIKNIFYPIVRKIDKLETSLRQKARDKSE